MRPISAKTLLTNRKRSRDFEAKSREERFRQGLKGVVVYLDEESRAFLKGVQKENGIRTIGDVVATIVQEKIAREKLTQETTTPREIDDTKIGEKTVAAPRRKGARKKPASAKAKNVTSTD